MDEVVLPRVPNRRWSRRTERSITKAMSMHPKNMSQDSAVAEPPVELEEPRRSPARRREEQQQRSKPKKLPPYAVVVLNDDHHTFDYVIETFRKVFGYSSAKCFLLALKIHTSGRAIVWSGQKEVAELKRDQIRSAGPDFHARKKVDFPLGVVLEPLPG